MANSGPLLVIPFSPMRQKPDNPADEGQREQRPDDAEYPDVDGVVCGAELLCDPLEEDDAVAVEFV